MLQQYQLRSSFVAALAAITLTLSMVRSYRAIRTQASGKIAYHIESWATTGGNEA